MNSEAILSLPPPPPDARIPYGNDPFQFGDLRLPQSAGVSPVVIVIHGGFWRSRYDLAHIGRLCAALSAQGFATWSVEYRRIGNPGGGFPGTFLDIAHAAKHLVSLAPQYHLDLDRVVALGHSAGGHLALWLAGHARVPRDAAISFPDPLPLRAAISLAGVADLRRAWALRLSSGVVEEFLGSPAEFPERYAAASPIELLPLGVRQVLVHGTADENVPFEISERYYSAARGQGDDVALIPLPGVGHFELIDPGSAVWERVQQVVAREM